MDKLEELGEVPQHDLQGAHGCGTPLLTPMATALQSLRLQAGWSSSEGVLPENPIALLKLRGN